jgi:REP element-mobilizing transposase RayT
LCKDLHITSRGNGRQAIFLDDQDNRKFLELLGRTVERYCWICHAFCLMVNHYHLMIETPEANLSKGMHHLNANYCQAHHKRYTTVGHLFQGRFKAVVVDRESYLLELARYVVLNPVRAGLVAHPEDWAWSSYRAMAGRSLQARLQPGQTPTSLPRQASQPEVPQPAVPEPPAAHDALPNAAPGHAAPEHAAPEPAQEDESPSAYAPEIAQPVTPPPEVCTPFLSTDWLLAQFGPNERAARQRYRDFIAAGIGLDSPWPQLQSQIFLGKETFIDTLKETIPEKTAVQEIPKSQRYANRPPLAGLFSSGRSKKKRDEAIVAGHLTYGYEQKEIASFLRIHYTTVSRIISDHSRKSSRRSSALDV